MTVTLQDLLATPAQPTPVAPKKPATITDLLAAPKPLPTVDEMMPPVQVPKGPTIEDLKPAPPDQSLTVEEVAQDPARMAAIRKMMSQTKDIKYETAPADEVMTDFMSHMRWMNTNEVSTAKELLNVMSADDATKSVYGDAYKVYDEMGSIFSNGDGWNGMLDYAGAIISSPSTWLGVGIGKVAGSASTKAASKTATKLAIDAATKEVVKKSAGKLSEVAVKNELKNTAAKAAARYHIAGALAAEAPLSTLQDYMYQKTQMETGVQATYSVLQGAIATLAGGISAIPGIAVLRSSSKSTLADVPNLLDKSFAQRAKSAAKRAVPQVKESLDKAQVDWMKLVEAGKGFADNIPLQNSVLDWFFSVKDENSLVRILHKEGADVSFEEGAFTRDLLAYANGMGDEALTEFNKAFEPLGVTFGEVSEILANTVNRGGQVLNKPSVASKFFREMQGVAVAKKTSNQALVDAAEDAVKNPAKDVELDEKNVIGYLSSSWKKALVSTFMTTAANVEGWGLARGATALSDMFIVGGLYGKAGIHALVNPAGAMKDVARANAIAQNQAFALKTLVDPFLSAEAFLALLDRAPSKVKKSVTGQIFGGVEDFSPERFGLNSKGAGVKAMEFYTEKAQKLSLVHLQDTLTKGVTGLTLLDRESRTAFGKGITKLIEEGEAWKLTDEMWDRTMKGVLRETFSEDLSKGKNLVSKVAKAIQTVSSSNLGGFVVPFGKFMNNTVAFMYRHSPLGLISVANHIGKKGMDETGEEMLARVAVGTTLFGFAAAQEGEKQAEGLQWFERRTADGSIEDTTNLFPYNVFSLVGRIAYNANRGEGGNELLIEELKKQVGPLKTIDDVASLQWLKPIVELLTDESVNSDASPVLEVIGAAANSIVGIAAGFTRPFDTYSKAFSYANPKAGGGLVADPKQSEGLEKSVLTATRYISGFFNYAFGEENEYGVRMIGTPKESVMVDGPVRGPNPISQAAGTKVGSPAKSLNKLLGMVDMPPFMAESFTSGNPEFDAYVNKEITPMLELRATNLLNNEVFKKMPQSQKIQVVNNLLKNTEADLLSLLEGGRIGSGEDRLKNERRKLLTKSRPARRHAMKELGITTPEHELSLFEIEAIQRRMDMDDNKIKTTK